MTTIDKLAWICIKENKILVARSKGKKLFYIPGGKREKGESDHEALTREIKEELSVDLIVASITPAIELIAQADAKAAGIQVKLACYFSDYIGIIKPASEIEAIQWFHYDDIEKGSQATQLAMEHLKKAAMIK